MPRVQRVRSRLLSITRLALQEAARLAQLRHAKRTRAEDCARSPRPDRAVLASRPAEPSLALGVAQGSCCRGGNRRHHPTKDRMQLQK
eukprot:6176019-Pleurochrysis_carterae.AAC.1